MRALTTRSRAGRRLAVAAAISVGAVVTALVVPSGSLSGLTGGAGRRLQEGVRRSSEDGAIRRPGIRHDLRGRRHPPAPRGEQRRARARPQRPAHEERRLPRRGHHQPRDRGPHHAGAGPARGRRRRGAAVPERAQAVQRPGQRDAHVLADRPLQHVQRLLRHPVEPVQPLARRRHHTDLHRVLDRRRRPAVLQAHRARPLPALQPRQDLPRRRPARRALRRRPRPQQQLGRHDAAAGSLQASRSPARAT